MDKKIYMLFLIFIVGSAFAQKGVESKKKIDNENKSFNKPTYTICKFVCGEDSNVIIDIAILLSPEITGAVTNSLRTATPSGSPSCKLIKHITFDLENGQMAFAPSNSDKTIYE